MKAIAKDADKKKEFSPTRSDNSIHCFRDESEGQIGSLGGVVGDIRRNGGTPSVESIATELSGMRAVQRAPALLALQQTHGNRYVQRVVAGIQAKLVVGPPGDIYEQEADRVADEVMRMPEPPMQRQIEEEEELVQPKLKTTPEHRIQRQEGEEEILLTKKREDTTHEVTHDLESRIHALRGGGQPLPEHLSAYFEPRFGYDFSHVRVHTDAKAAESARTLNARAYTMGRDVAFGAGQYAPGTHAGNHLLAHELTHTIQQGSSVPRLQHKIAESQIVNTPEVGDVSIRMLKRSSTTIQSMPVSYSTKLIRRDADKPPIKTSNNTIDAQQESTLRVQINCSSG